MKYIGDENRFKYDGMVYTAVETKDECSGCAFEVQMGYNDCFISPHCTPKERKDKRNVIFIEEKQKEKEMDNTKIFNDKKYKVKKFNLIDIYKAKPKSCDEFDREFISLMEEWSKECLLPTDCWNTNGYAAFGYLPTLEDSIPWLIEKGFMEEIKKETKLEVGMILTRDLGAEYICIPKGDSFELLCIKEDPYSSFVGKKLPGSFSTLEEVINTRWYYKFYIKK